MGNVNGILYTAKQAILSNLTAINVTGSNISNVSTEGYTRRVAVFQAVGTSDPTSSAEQIGVEISEIQRIYDKYLDAQVVSQNSTVGNATTRKNLLTQIEGILNESDGGGINDALSNFWSAWEDLAANPSGETERNTLISDAEALTDVFNQRADDLSTIQSNADKTISDDIDKINCYLTELSEYNAEIVKVESAGGEASSLRDNRTVLLGKISSLIEVNYVEQSDGSYYVYLPDSGKSLVEGTNSWQLKVVPNSDNSNFNDIVFADDATASSLNEDITGGEIGGLLNIRDVILPKYIDELNQTVSSIVNKVNAQQTAGYDQDGNSGILFFTNTTEAKYMAVNSAIVADARKIAASATVNADGDNAAAIAAIADDKMYASLTVTAGTGSVTGKINNIGQSYKDTTSDITLTRGTSAGTWTISDNGGYTSLNIISASDRSISLDLNGNGTADITLSLSGTWTSGNQVAFSLAKQDSTTTIGGYYNAFIAEVGEDVSNSGTTLNRETTIADQITSQRESISGVSLDEEMLNLIKYQMSYNAASRLAKTVSELMDILINLGQQ